MNLNEMKIGDLLPLLAVLNGGKTESAFEIGKQYLVRTVTFTLTGKLKGINAQELVFENAAWIADTGRFYEALKNGVESTSSSEVEPFINDVIVGRGALVDATEYTATLPKNQK